MTLTFTTGRDEGWFNRFPEASFIIIATAIKMPYIPDCLDIIDITGILANDCAAIYRLDSIDGKRIGRFYRVQFSNCSLIFNNGGQSFWRAEGKSRKFWGGQNSVTGKQVAAEFNDLRKYFDVKE